MQFAANRTLIPLLLTVSALALGACSVGGGLMEAIGPRYLKWVTDAFRQNVFPSTLRSCQVLASKLGDDAGVVGAADLARQRL